VVEYALLRTALVRMTYQVGRLGCRKDTNANLSTLRLCRRPRTCGTTRALCAHVRQLRIPPRDAPRVRWPRVSRAIHSRDQPALQLAPV